MKLDEMIALAKAGYKKKDIDAIIASENEKANNTSHDANSENAGDSPAETESTGEESATEEAAPTEEDITNEALKDAYAEIESLKKDLAKAQAANVNKEVSDNGDDDAKTVEDIVRSFM